MEHKIIMTPEELNDIIKKEIENFTEQLFKKGVKLEVRENYDYNDSNHFDINIEYDTTYNITPQILINKTKDKDRLTNYINGYDGKIYTYDAIYVVPTFFHESLYKEEDFNNF